MEEQKSLSRKIQEIRERSDKTHAEVMRMCQRLDARDPILSKESTQEVRNLTLVNTNSSDTRIQDRSNKPPSQPTSKSVTTDPLTANDTPLFSNPTSVKKSGPSIDTQEEDEKNP